MSTPFLGCLMPCSWGFAAKGWAQCNGQLMAINTNQALFSLLGTTFGGDGRVTFGLPNLQGVTPMGAGLGPGLSNYTLGQVGGEPAHTLTTQEMAAHNHSLSGSNQNVSLSRPAGNIMGVTGANALYNSLANQVGMNPAVVSMNGSNAAHENRQPFLTINWLIALVGIFPSQG